MVPRPKTMTMFLSHWILLVSICLNNVCKALPYAPAGLTHGPEFPQAPKSPSEAQRAEPGFNQPLTSNRMDTSSEPNQEMAHNAHSSESQSRHRNLSTQNHDAACPRPTCLTKEVQDLSQKTTGAPTFPMKANIVGATICLFTIHFTAS